jgi:hypothetical protein
VTTWIEPSDLLRLVASSPFRGEESPSDVIMRNSNELIPVSDATLPPLDIYTYEVGLQRWRDGEGPRLQGMEEFVSALHRLDEPARAVTVAGTVTTYAYLLDSDMTRMIAGVAIDPPPGEAKR